MCGSIWNCLEVRRIGNLFPPHPPSPPCTHSLLRKCHLTLSPCHLVKSTSNNLNSKVNKPQPQLEQQFHLCQCTLWDVASIVNRLLITHIRQSTTCRRWNFANASTIAIRLHITASGAMVRHCISMRCIKIAKKRYFTFGVLAMLRPNKMVKSLWFVKTVVRD